MKGFLPIAMTIIISGCIGLWMDVGLNVEAPTVYWMLGTFFGALAFGLAYVFDD